MCSRRLCVKEFWCSEMRELGLDSLGSNRLTLPDRELGVLAFTSFRPSCFVRARFVCSNFFRSGLICSVAVCSIGNVALADSPASEVLKSDLVHNASIRNGVNRSGANSLAGVHAFSSGGVGLTRGDIVQGTVSPERAARARQLNEEGVELILSGEHARGRAKLNEALRQDNGNGTVLYNLAGIELSNSRPKQAIRYMESAISVAPNDLSFMNRLAEALVADSNIPRATEWYERIVSVDPSFGEAVVRLGVLYGMMKQNDKAEETLRRAVHLRPEDGKALSSLGSVLVMCEKYQEAREVLVKAQSINKTAENAAALGIASESLGDREGALKYFREAGMLGDNDPNLKKHILELEQVVAQNGTAALKDQDTDKKGDFE